MMERLYAAARCAVLEERELGNSEDSPVIRKVKIDLKNCMAMNE